MQEKRSGFVEKKTFTTLLSKNQIVNLNLNFMNCSLLAENMEDFFSQQ